MIAVLVVPFSGLRACPAIGSGAPAFPGAFPLRDVEQCESSLGNR